MINSSRHPARHAVSCARSTNLTALRAGQTTIKARSKFFYFTSIIVAGQKTTLLKVCPFQTLCSLCAWYKCSCKYCHNKEIRLACALLQLEKHIFDKFHDPRVHFAINSASWSSPRLPKVCTCFPLVVHCPRPPPHAMSKPSCGQMFQAIRIVGTLALSCEHSFPEFN